MDKSPHMYGQDWQRWATKLLHCRYPAGDYQEVPDTHAGDAGIEGFSIPDGRVYQMYGPEGELTPAERHRKIRDKISDDIKKFIDNRDKLCRVLGSLKIRRWVLFVPLFDSRLTVEHAAKKTAEVRQANLPYVDADDFRVVVVQRDAFSVEDQHLLSRAVDSIVLEPHAVSAEDIQAWSEDAGNLQKAGNLERKTSRLPTLNALADRIRFRNEVVKWWIDGQNVLEELRAYPEVWESVRRVKSEKEKFLKGHCMVSESSPGNLLMGALEDLQTAVGREAAALSDGAKAAIAHEAVADWLMRCPLDFPETIYNE